jgi:hypothetical protein
MFAKRFPSEYAALKNAVNEKIVSFMSSTEGNFVFVKFRLDQPKVLFMIPYDYPTSKMQVSFTNEVPNHPFYFGCKENINLATVSYFKNCVTIIDYINTIHESLDDITNGIKNMSINNTNI